MTESHLKGHLEGLLPGIDSDIAWEKGNIKRSKELLSNLTKRKAEVVAALKVLYPPEPPPGPREWERAYLIPEGVVAKTLWMYIVKHQDRYFMNAISNGFGRGPGVNTAFEDGWIEASRHALNQHAREVFL